MAVPRTRVQSAPFISLKSIKLGGSKQALAFGFGRTGEYAHMHLSEWYPGASTILPEFPMLRFRQPSRDASLRRQGLNDTRSSPGRQLYGKWLNSPFSFQIRPVEAQILRSTELPLQISFYSFLDEYGIKTHFVYFCKLSRWVW